MKNKLKYFILGFMGSLILMTPIFVLSAPNLSERLKGKILLAVEDHGKTYYVHEDGKRYRVTQATAQKIFEKLALGITDDDLAKIPENDTGINPEAQLCNSSAPVIQSNNNSCPVVESVNCLSQESKIKELENEISVLKNNSQSVVTPNPEPVLPSKPDTEVKCNISSSKTSLSCSNTFGSNAIIKSISFSVAEKTENAFELKIGYEGAPRTLYLHISEYGITYLNPGEFTISFYRSGDEYVASHDISHPNVHLANNKLPRIVQIPANSSFRFDWNNPKWILVNDTTERATFEIMKMEVSVNGEIFTLTDF